VEREMVVSGDTFGLFSSRFQKCHNLHLLATTSTWFLLGITFYSQNLFQKDIFSKVGWISPARTMNDIEKVFRVSRAQALIALCGTVPGYKLVHHGLDRHRGQVLDPGHGLPHDDHVHDHACCSVRAYTKFH
jgi:hypothetical protein